LKNLKKRSQKAKLFDPDTIATTVHQALSRDLLNHPQMYRFNDSITRNAFNRQRDEFLKKYVSPSIDQDQLETETLEKFLSVNDHMLDYNIKNCLLDIDDDPCFRNDSLDLKVLKRTKDLLSFVLGNLDEEELFLECRNSSGTSIGVSYSDTSNENKFSYPMSVTSSAKPLFQRYLQFDYKLEHAIQELNSASVCGERFNVVKGSRATTVDKTATKRRFIAIEPTCNMFLQQGMMRVMYKRLDAVGLDVSTLPDRHKQLARESSITGKNSTIDWSSASDCVSIELLRQLLPTRWFALIDQVRSPSTTIRGKEVDLHMVSSMGNAGTFPLETLVFWAFAISTIVSLKNTTASRLPDWETFGEASVFGDDCIVPTSCAEEFISVMTAVGFIINKEKSFYGTEQFRESCGGDYLSGYDNRPFNLRAPASNRLSALEPWLYIILNATLKKYIMYFGVTNYVYDKAIFHCIFGLFDSFGITVKLVPPEFPDDSGLKMSSDIQRFVNHYSVKLNRIDISHHGVLRFAYCSYQYGKKRVLDENLQYYLKLKNFRASEKKPFKKKDIRRNGGYVVAKGRSGHWSIPVVTPVPG